MKELRSSGGNLRALFAFDPRRRAVVLVGGDKTGDWSGWYKRNIPRADRRYDHTCGAWERRNLAVQVHKELG